MTQEELDALMNGGDLENLEALEAKEETKEIKEEVKENSNHSEKMTVKKEDAEKYGKISPNEWPPPPPTEEHKVVHQLDDVTRDSEVKATQIFDQLDLIGASAEKIAKMVKKIQEPLQKHQGIFDNLHGHFPNIESFKTALNEQQEILNALKSIEEEAANCSDSSMQAMDIMQFQDIHRQKIERVVNVMRALSQYMNSLFEGKIDDSKRVSSATYITGDDDKDLASADDIEALIASFGAK
ncbi:protein phosphatase CheZ [Helicobacter pylori]|uniref:protein phosphatase CheZ n=1 Tax=Helicobacter pylori TaxID=210 RepID=UPI00192102BA|nr:protein phosphatase CheZ [Helicobacter pylori]QQW61244.1 chemotaxis protein [Helicobacter pylori]QQW62685.1 chemotaxis protein [Helicobacter pylori]QQW94615.1 chemotaxis protein [Helicobacter pylori]QQW97494.1 chemotaxis protein [Helicobacter pylori]